MTMIFYLLFNNHSRAFSKRTVLRSLQIRGVTRLAFRHVNGPCVSPTNESFAKPLLRSRSSTTCHIQETSSAVCSLMLSLQSLCCYYQVQLMRDTGLPLRY